MTVTTNGISADKRVLPMPGDLAEPAFDENAMRVLEERYFARLDENGTKETPKQFLWRIGSAIAHAERKYAERRGEDPDEAQMRVARDFYGLHCRRDFIANTPCLVNAGRPLSMLSACFVLPIEDSMHGIYQTIHDTALIHKSGGGTGFHFGDLRHARSLVKSTGRDASGPIPFAKVLDKSTDAISQSGVRRGANMGTMVIHHPDIFEFMNAKKALDNENLALYNRMADTGLFSDAQLALLKQELLQTQFKNFNLSVAATKKFMDLVCDGDFDADFDLYDPQSMKPPNAPQVVKTVKVRDLWNAIVDGAWKNGEPGILFIEHPKANPLPGLGPIFATNPCGEQFLHGFDSCNLGSVNVGNFYDEATGDVDWARLGEVVRLSCRFLDNVIDENLYPLPQIEEMVKNNRRIGLGIMGFSDLLVRLGIGYGTPKAIAFARKLMRFLLENGETMGEELAAVRGEFPNKHLSVFANDQKLRRWTAILSIAPTGTIAMIAGCSFSCEPYFGLAFAKHVMKGADGRAQTLNYVVPAFEKVARERGFWRDTLFDEILANNGSCRGLAGVPEDVQEVFRVAADVSVEEHIDMLAAFQESTCNAVSKTINAPNHHTREEVERAIIRAYKSGCKGFTYYRDGSRSEQVVTFSDKSDLDKVESDDDILAKAKDLLAS